MSSKRLNLRRIIFPSFYNILLLPADNMFVKGNLYLALIYVFQSKIIILKHDFLSFEIFIIRYTGIFFLM